MHKHLWKRVLFRVLSWLQPNETPTQQEIQGMINVARAEERQRLSQPLPNATGSPSAVAEAWVAPITPTVAQLSPVPPQRAPVLSARQRAIIRQMRLEQRRLQTTGIVQSIQIAQLTRLAAGMNAPTLHTLPTPPPEIARLIDAQSLETPGEQAIVIEDVQDEGEPTEHVAALSATEQLAYWSKRKMA
jgi:hypothetical protein